MEETHGAEGARATDRVVCLLLDIGEIIFGSAFYALLKTSRHLLLHSIPKRENLLPHTRSLQSESQPPLASLSSAAGTSATSAVFPQD